VQLRRGRGRRLAGAALSSMAVAEAGRRRAGGAERFPLSGSLLAPAWIGERAVCSWLALGARLRGGARYGDGRLPHAATPTRRLRRRYAESAASGSASERTDSGSGTTGAGEATPLSARKRVVL
jgi:hypothetical protein